MRAAPPALLVWLERRRAPLGERLAEQARREGVRRCSAAGVPTTTSSPSEMAAKSDKPRFVVRTARHGQVTIDGRAYAPDQRHVAYDGRLEGLRFAFGRYPHDPHVVALWGSHDAYHASRRTASPADLGRYEHGQCDCPEAVDGALPWMSLHEVRT